MMPVKWGEESSRTWAAVLLMGHLDVWAYVIQSQRAASNSPPLSQGFSSATIDLRLASSTPAVMAQATGAIRVLRCPSHRLPPPAPAHIHTEKRERAHTLLSHCPCNSWPDLDLPLENPAAEALCCSCILQQTEAKLLWKYRNKGWINAKVMLKIRPHTETVCGVVNYTATGGVILKHRILPSL